MRSTTLSRGLQLQLMVQPLLAVSANAPESMPLQPCWRAVSALKTQGQVRASPLLSAQEAGVRKPPAVMEAAGPGPQQHRLMPQARIL